MIGLIENETPLLPWIIADAVTGELSRWAAVEIPQAISDKLATKAQHIYEHNETFRKRVKSAAGREHLYCFMRHWLTAEMGGRIADVEIPHYFANGLPLESSRP